MFENHLKDDEFRRQYAAAVEGLSAGEIKQVAALSDKQRYEWVRSPPPIRPELLARWAREADESRTSREALKQSAVAGIHSAHTQVAETLSTVANELHEYRLKQEASKSWWQKFIEKF